MPATICTRTIGGDVLDAYIIEEIKKQEEERRRRTAPARPRMHIEIPAEDEEGVPDPHREEESPDDGTVIHIDL